MDATDIVKGIEHFFGNILPKAYHFSEWDENSFTNAFHWADFCEQVYKNYNDKPCKEKLDKLIHSLSLNFQNASGELCFEDLKKSTEILCEAFFENASVENDSVESVLLRVKNDKSSFEVIKEGHELDSLCCEIIEALKPIKIINSERSFYSEIMATLYLKTLETSVQQMTNEEQVEHYLSNSLEKLCESEDKMIKLMQVLALKLAEDESTCLKDTQEFSINWTMYKVLSHKNHPLAGFIWKRPSELRAISLNSTDFLNFYLDFLTECSSSLTSVLVDDEVEWIPRCSTKEVLSFNEIFNHFRTLLRTDDCVCESTKGHLLNLLNTKPEMEIWKEIFSRVT